MSIPHPEHVGWKLEDITGTYATTATSTLAQIYETLTGEKKSVATVKELSERSGRAVIVFIQQDSLRFYTPSRYQFFSPLALAYVPSSGLFGVATNRQTHHDFVCYLCAYGVRIENVADVPKHMLYPYTMGANRATDDAAKLKLLHKGRMMLVAVAKDVKGVDYFNQAITTVLKTEKQLSEIQALSMFKQKFTGKSLSKIDVEGAAYAEELSHFLNDHGGDTKVAIDLNDASTEVSKELDAITATTSDVRLTDELLATVNSRATMVAKKFTECMGPYNISVENDIYPWTTLSDMESGDVPAISARHKAFHRYRQDKISGEYAFAELVSRKNSVAPIDINHTIHMVSVYNHKVKEIQGDLQKLAQQMNRPPSNLRKHQTELAEMILQGEKFTDLVGSLQRVFKVAADNTDITLSVIVELFVKFCKELSLQNIVSKYVHIQHNIAAVGETLRNLNVGVETKLQNARFHMEPAHLVTVSALLQGDAESKLRVNFKQRTVVTDFVNLQPMGSPNISPFLNALNEWAELIAMVENVAQNMTARMVKFADFGAADPKIVLSMKLHSVSEYEHFAEESERWNIIDISGSTVQQIMRENLKFIRVMLAAFPNQDDPNCASLRSFTNGTNLTYTLNKKDSVLSAILAHNTYVLVDNFSETGLDSVNVPELTNTYIESEMRVKDLETLVHYLLKGYIETGEYASFLHHLSENRERVSLLQHIVEEHMADSSEEEEDKQRAHEIFTQYTSSFVIPHKANMACLDKRGVPERVMMENHSDFLATSSILSNIVANRMLEGVDMEKSTVEIKELVTAVRPHRLYILKHSGSTLGYGHYFPEATNGVPFRSWRDRLIVQLRSKKWDVNMGEIIDLHSKVYNPRPEIPQMPEGLSDATFFLGHANQDLVVWRVMESPPTPFPDESPHTITFGNTVFTMDVKRPVMMATQHAPSIQREETQADDWVNVQNEGPGRDKGNKINVYDMSAITAAIDSILPTSPVPPQIATPNALPASEQVMAPASKTAKEEVTACQNERSGHAVLTKQVNDTRMCGYPLMNAAVDAIGLARNTPTHRPNTTFTQMDTTGNNEPMFVTHTAFAKPWSILRGQSDESGYIMHGLMQARIELSDSDSEENIIP